MNKHLIVLGIAVLLICVGLSGCEELNTENDGNTVSQSDRFIGTWKNEGNSYEIITLFSDGACSYLGISGFWELKDGKLVLDLYTSGLTITYDYYFSEEYTKLNLRQVGGDNYSTYTKQ